MPSHCRVGKTSLMRKALSDGPLLFFFVGRKSKAELCKNFSLISNDRKNSPRRRTVASLYIGSHLWYCNTM